MKKQLILLVSAMFLVLTGFSQSLQDAIKLTNSERYEDASATFKNLVKTDAKGDAWFYYADNFMKWEDLDSARIVLKQGLTSFPNNALIHAGFGKLSILEGKGAEAAPHFTKSTEIVKAEGKSMPKDAQAVIYEKMAEGYIFAESKNPDAALTYLAEAEKLNPKDPEVFVLRAYALLAKSTGDASEAIKNFVTAYELDKSSRRALLGQANLYRDVNNFEEALVYYNQAINLDPGFAPAYRERAELYKRAGKIAKGIEDYRKYLELNNSPSARARYAKFLFLAKDYANTIKEINDVLAQGYSDPILYRILGFSLYETKNYAEGLKNTEKFRELAKGGRPKLIMQDYSYYGKLLAENGKDSLGILELKKAMEIDPTFVDGYSDIASIYFKQKNFQESAKYYRLKIEKAPKPDYNDYNYLGRALYQSKNYTGADSAFTKVIEFLPNLTIGYYWSALSKNAQDSQDNLTGLAKPMFEKVVEIGSADVTKNKKDLIKAYEYLGYFYFTKKDFNCSKSAYLKLKELDPENAKLKETKVLETKELMGASGTCELVKPAEVKP